MKKEKNSKNFRPSNQTLPTIDPNSFNQTIIINNPNININYIENSDEPKIKNNHKTIIQTTLYNQKNTNKGTDNWNFNKNLKEFSETKNKGMYKKNEKSQKNNNQSPYLMHKTKTQQLRNHIKNTAYNNLHSFREHRTISTIKKETLTPIQKEADHNSESKNKFRTKIHLQNPKRPKNPIDISSSKLNNLQLYSNSIIDTDKTQNIKQKIKEYANSGRKRQDFRKNRFMRSQTPVSEEDESEKNMDEKDIQNIEESLILSQQMKKRQEAKVPKRIIQKSIEKISNTFLKKTDYYFDQIETVDIPSSKIQIYTTTITQPTSNQHYQSYRSSFGQQSKGGYEFSFDEEKKKPKYNRNRMYEEI